VSITSNAKNSLSACALILAENNYENKQGVYNVLSVIKESDLKDEIMKYLFNSTITNYRLGMIYQEWAENGYKVADLSNEEKKIIVVILY